MHSQDLKIVIHGYTEDVETSDWMTDTKDEYLRIVRNQFFIKLYSF